MRTHQNLWKIKEHLSLGSSNQNNIGLDRNSFKFNYNYAWSNSKKFFNFSPLEIELINNKNIENYFNIYSNSYEQINLISKKYTTQNILLIMNYPFLMELIYL